MSRMQPLPWPGPSHIQSVPCSWMTAAGADPGVWGLPLGANVLSLQSALSDPTMLA